MVDCQPPTTIAVSMVLDRTMFPVCRQLNQKKKVSVAMNLQLTDRSEVRDDLIDLQMMHHHLNPNQLYNSRSHDKNQEVKNLISIIILKKDLHRYLQRRSLRSNLNHKLSLTHKPITSQPVNQIYSLLSVKSLTNHHQLKTEINHHLNLKKK